jgi:hypothetical protein
MAIPYSIKKPTIIQSNAELKNGKYFQDLVKLVDKYIPCNSLESLKILKELSAFIGFKDLEMNRIANHN